MVEIGQHHGTFDCPTSYITILLVSHMGCPILTILSAVVVDVGNVVVVVVVPTVVVVVLGLDDMHVSTWSTSNRDRQNGTTISN